MTGSLNRTLLLIAGVMLLTAFAGAYPKPSAYPVSWELKFKHSQPKRLLVTPKGSRGVEAFWYMTYTVTNLSKEERKFLPVFEVLTDDDRVIRSDADIPPVVLETIRIREKNHQLLSATEVGGTLRVGEDQTKDGVVIWREPQARMGQFSIFAGGLSGEAVVMRDEKGKEITKPVADGKTEPVVMWKTLQMHYHVAGDEAYPGNDVVELVEEQWVMR